MNRESLLSIRIVELLLSIRICLELLIVDEDQLATVTAQTIEYTGLFHCVLSISPVRKRIKQEIKLFVFIPDHPEPYAT